MSRKITLMIIPEGSQDVFSRTFSSTFFKIILGIVILWLATLLVITFFYSRLSITAARSSMLQEENENLRGYLARVVEIEKNFKKNRELAERLAQMAGVDLESYENPDGSDFDSMLAEAPESHPSDIVGYSGDFQIPLSRKELAGQIVPLGRPLYGWITRSFTNDEESVEKHLGFDFAVKKGTPVSTTASGAVTFAGWDDTYGNLVIIDHGNGYETMYGHNEKILVEEGESVLKGDVVALSGNTGRSSAPHLHYEIRKNGEAVDPAPYLE
ncbi:MAG: M23 family metallopeptidase [candidate division Zixibacteria bacterium]